MPRAEKITSENTGTFLYLLQKTLDLANRLNRRDARHRIWDVTPFLCCLACAKAL